MPWDVLCAVQGKPAAMGSGSTNSQEYHHQDHQQDQKNHQAASATILHTLSMRTTEPESCGSWAGACVRCDPQELAHLGGGVTGFRVSCSQLGADGLSHSPEAHQSRVVRFTRRDVILKESRG